MSLGNDLVKTVHSKDDWKKILQKVKSGHVWVGGLCVSFDSYSNFSSFF